MSNTVLYWLQVVLVILAIHEKHKNKNKTEKTKQSETEGKKYFWEAMLN